MQDKCSDDACEDWKKAAHKLKGSAANLGAEQLSYLCALAEQGYEQNEEKKRDMFNSIRMSYEEVHSLLQQ